MTRIVNRVLDDVKTDVNGVPTVLTTGKTVHVVKEILDSWQEAGRWIAGEPTRYLWRIYTGSGTVYDIERAGTVWRIYRIWD